MANKRGLKKRIKYICGDLASDALIASVLFPEKVDENKINAIINEIVALQEDTLALTSFVFDRGRREFANDGEYRAARKNYFSVAFKKLNKDFIERALEIVKQLNEVVPVDARRAVSKV